MTIAELAQRVAAWHMVTFPDHTAEEVAAKLLEEAFELQDARGDVNVADELAEYIGQFRYAESPADRNAIVQRVIADQTKKERN